MKNALASLAIACATIVASPAYSQLTIEIAGVGANRIPVAIADFAGDPATARALTSVIRSDLERSGLFRLIEPGGVLSESAPVNYGDIKGKGADALVGGSLTPLANTRLEARARLYDVNKQVALISSAYTISSPQLRAAAHRIADDIYEKLTGEKGVFSTRIAYVTRAGGRYELKIADMDGENAQAALISKEPIISPVWSPDGKSIAYVSFQNKKPEIYVRVLNNRDHHIVANFKGSNSAPAWSPDGRRLAIVLTKDGYSQIYSINADGSGLKRLSQSQSIDTEPRFSPDGTTIYFTSDRGGSPQIYRMSADGGDVQRITFEGSYNVTPRPSPDGKTLAYITRREGHFQLAVMDLANRQTQIISDSKKDESPSFAPNGRMILMATEIGGRGVLSAVSVDGRNKQRLSIPAGDVREPAWGPYFQ